MEVSRIRALRGPNRWSRRTALEAVVICNAAESAIERLPGFEARVRALFPAIGAFRQSGPAVPVSLAHVLEAAALGLQAAAGCPVTFSLTAATGDRGTFQVIVEYGEEAVGRLALELAQALVDAALQGCGFDLEAATHKLRQLDEDERLGPSTGAIVDAAVARGIPYRRLTKGSLVQFGWGSRQRRIQAAEIASEAWGTGDRRGARATPDRSNAGGQRATLLHARAYLGALPLRLPSRAPRASACSATASERGAPTRSRVAC